MTCHNCLLQCWYCQAAVLLWHVRQYASLTCFHYFRSACAFPLHNEIALPYCTECYFVITLNKYRFIECFWKYFIDFFTWANIMRCLFFLGGDSGNRSVLCYEITVSWKVIRSLSFWQQCELYFPTFGKIVCLWLHDRTVETSGSAHSATHRLRTET